MIGTRITGICMDYYGSHTIDSDFTYCIPTITFPELASTLLCRFLVPPESDAFSYVFQISLARPKHYSKTIQLQLEFPYFEMPGI